MLSVFNLGCFNSLFSNFFFKGAVNGGLYLCEAELPKTSRTINVYINVYINVVDIEASLATVKASGGQVTKEKFLIGADIGYAAYFTDTEGNGLVLFSRT